MANDLLATAILGTRSLRMKRDSTFNCTVYQRLLSESHEPPSPPLPTNTGTDFYLLVHSIRRFLSAETLPNSTCSVFVRNLRSKPLLVLNYYINYLDQSDVVVRFTQQTLFRPLEIIYTLANGGERSNKLTYVITRVI